MIAAIQVIFRGLNDVRLKGYTYIWANVAFVALALPIVTAPAAFSALCRVAHAARTQNHEADLELFWQTFKENLWRAMPWGAVHLLYGVINFSNITAYISSPNPLFKGLWVIWLGSTPFWLAVLLYTWFIYYEMEQPDLIGATRNALVMVVVNPVFTLTLMVAIILLSVISTFLVAAWLLLTWGFIASLGAEAVLNRLNVFREAEQQTG
jgi:uncharacterized membrane protein YesL